MADDMAQEAGALDIAMLRWLRSELGNQGILTTDAELRIRTWNHWLERQSGLLASEVSGRNLLEVFPELAARRMDQYYRDALGGQVRLLAQPFHGYLLPLRPTAPGTPFARMQQTARIAPLLDERRVIGTLTIIDDVTERVAIEAELRNRIAALEELQHALRRSEEWLSTTLRSIGDAVIAADLQGRVILMNDVAQSLTGWSEREARGSPLPAVFRSVSEKTRAEVDDPVSEIIGGGSASPTRHAILIARDGRETPIDESAAPIKDERGEFTGVVLVFRDVTERKLAEARREWLLEQEQQARETAEAATRAKDEFLAVVSHELRNPLNAILGYARLARMNLHDAERVANSCEIIERNAKSQQQLIEDLLDTARIISGKLRLDLRQVEFSDVVMAALDVVRPASEAKNIALVVNLDPAGARITGDPDRLQQIVWNLLSNAIKFTPAGGRIDVTLAREGSEVALTVRDTGRGISPEFMPHVFDRFRQVDSSGARRFGGLGLGLALVKQLVELHGGTIEALSGGAGLGSTFTVRLPQRAAHNDAPQRHQPDAARAGAGTTIPRESVPRLDGVNVLLLGDEEESRQIVERGLGELGAKVTTAATVSEACAAAAEARFDVLLCDIAVTSAPGREVLRRIRALEKQLGAQHSERIPAIALTSMARSEARLQALGAGFQTHVSKPVDLAELAVVIRSALDARMGSASG